MPAIFFVPSLQCRHVGRRSIPIRPINQRPSRVELRIDGHGAVATVLVDGATVGGVTGPERLRLRSPLAYMELRECVS